MKLCAADYVILIVEDLDRTLRFYIDVMGLTLGHRSGEYVQLVTGTTRLAFYTRTAMAKTLRMDVKKPAQDAPGFEIGFKVKDVDTAFAELVERGAVPVMPRTTRFWGQRTAYIKDPDGHLIELAQEDLYGLAQEPK